MISSIRDGDNVWARQSRRTDLSSMTAADLDNLRREYDVIPLVRELSTDMITPVSAFSAISGSGGEAFLLESVERGEALGRYSFIGFDPRRTLTFDSESIHPIETLRTEFRTLRVFGEDQLPPFFGGAVAWFGYECARWRERLQNRHPNDLMLPDAKVLFMDHVIVFDHLKQRLILVANLFASDERDALELLDAAKRRLDETETLLSGARVDLGVELAATRSTNFSSNCSRDQFLAAVSKAKEEIASGEAFQIVLSQRWDADFDEGASLDLYRALRSVNPSPYMFLLRTEECTLVGSSPEMLVRVKGDRVETRPIAGTRPRGDDQEEDERLAMELLDDPKENAEHLMLLDLGRNDLGRVCGTGTVLVDEFRKVERYSHVMHLVSSVSGRLRADQSPIDAFFSAFPAGTVSGAPKIRAMEIIDDLESTRRGPYAGAVAYIGFSGNLDSCIAIRTIVLRNGRAWIQAGAGIVFDSVPEREFEECSNKSAALRRAIEIAATNIPKGAV